MIDYRGGLHETHGTAQLLALLALASGRFSSKRIGIYAGIVDLVLGAGIVIGAHFIRTSIR